MNGKKENTQRCIDPSKRRFLKSAGSTMFFMAVPPFVKVAIGGTQGKRMTHDEIIRMGVSEGVEALRSGRLTAVEYSSAALAQAEKFRDYNIFTQISPYYVQTTAAALDKKRKEGKSLGALQGLPYALKDSVDMVEYYTISGHPSLKRFEPRKDADLVKILKEADAICIGKTQIPALSLWWTTENPLTGDTGNPFNKAYKTGGSSGGSGAAVAARIVPFAIGEDTGGSIRVPAAINGVQGFRPTTGRWPTAGTMPIGFSDTLGPIARSVADIKLLDSICATDHPRHEPTRQTLKGRRIGYQVSWFLENLHPWVEQNWEDTLKLLSKAGATLVEIKGLPANEGYDLAIGILLADFPGAVARYFNRQGVYNISGFGLIHEMHMDTLKKIWLPGLDHSAFGEEYFRLVEKLFELRKAYNRIMTENRIDLLMYPTSKAPNTPNDGPDIIAAKGPLGNIIPETMFGSNMLFAPLQRTPSISLFSGMDKNGLPLGVTFDGYKGKDKDLLDLAEAIEKVLPPLQEPPTI
jgi:mandelamide amidase